YDEGGRRVAADRHQSAVSERDLARVAGEQVQPDDRDEEDAGVCEVAGVEVADEGGRDEVDEHRRGGDEQPEPDAEGATTHQTRLTASRPNRPVGRMSSTPRMT